jgi:hypothetical protein
VSDLSGERVEALWWRDVDFAGRKVIVRRAVSGDVWVEPDGAGGSARSRASGQGSAALVAAEGDQSPVERRGGPGRAAVLPAPGGSLWLRVPAEL